MGCCFPRSEACQLKRDLPFRIANPGSPAPLSSEHGTNRTVKAQFWPWLACNSFKTFEVVPFSHLHVEVRVGLERGELVDFDDPGRRALIQHDVESQHCEAREAHLRSAGACGVRASRLRGAACACKQLLISRDQMATSGRVARGWH